MLESHSMELGPSHIVFMPTIYINPISQLLAGQLCYLAIEVLVSRSTCLHRSFKQKILHSNHTEWKSTSQIFSDPFSLTLNIHPLVLDTTAMKNVLWYLSSRPKYLNWSFISMQVYQKIVCHISLLGSHLSNIFFLNSDLLSHLSSHQ